MEICRGIVVAALVSLSTLCSAQERSGQPLRVDWTLTKTGTTLEREALITITDRAGKPVSNARVEVSVDMPSMPGMHSVPVAQAKPTGTAGRYAVRFVLAMPGQWAAHIEVKAPQRVKTVKKFHAD